MLCRKKMINHVVWKKMINHVVILSEAKNLFYG